MLKREYKGQKTEAVLNELKRISEKFSKMHVSVIHEVPKGYWENQKGSIMNQIATQESSALKKRSNYKRLFYLTSTAAVIVVLILMFPLEETLFESELSLDSIELSALEDYLLDEAGSLDTKLSLEDTFYDNELWSNEGSQTRNNE